MRSLVAAALFAALFAALVPRASAASGNYVNLTTTYYTDAKCTTKCTDVKCGGGNPVASQIEMDKCIASVGASLKYSGSCSGGTATAYLGKTDCTGTSTSAPNPPFTCTKSSSMTVLMGADTYRTQTCVNGPGVTTSSASAVAPSMAAAVLLGVAVSALSRS